MGGRHQNAAVSGRKRSQEEKESGFQKNLSEMACPMDGFLDKIAHRVSL